MEEDDAGTLDGLSELRMTKFPPSPPPTMTEEEEEEEEDAAGGGDDRDLNE